MKADLVDIHGKKKKEITLPNCFSEQVRVGLIQRIIENKKIRQPYGPSPAAGNNYSASGKMKHHRKVWKSQYGRGMSRVPRKMLTRRGSQFNWVGATVPNTRGGRRAHPPKVASMIGLLKVNKKELKLALMGALSATVSPFFVKKRYASLNDLKVDNTAFVVESGIQDLKAKKLLESVKKILGEKLFSLAIQKKSVRAGKGKARGRKYKSNLGLLLVLGEGEKLKTTAFDVVSVKKLGVNDLANGGVGRITIYSEEAIKYLGEKLKE